MSWRGRGRGGNRRGGRDGNRRGGRGGPPRGQRRRPSPLALDLEELVTLMVEAPTRVRVHEHRQERSTLFRLRLAEEDLGKVIGRQGRTARALRTLLDARGDVDERNYALEIREW